MFDIGFSELFVIAVVALIVLGPERLPKAARYTGLWVRRARAQWYAVKAEFENELADDELRRSLRDTGQQLRDARDAVHGEGERMIRDVRSAVTPAPTVGSTTRDVHDEDAAWAAPDAMAPPAATPAPVDGAPADSQPVDSRPADTPGSLAQDSDERR
jgi:sec-independent protein translocase protein TatB